MCKQEGKEQESERVKGTLVKFASFVTYVNFTGQGRWEGESMTEGGRRMDEKGRFALSSLILAKFIRLRRAVIPPGCKA
jgi:hypothetical protein